MVTGVSSYSIISAVGTGLWSWCPTSFTLTPVQLILCLCYVLCTPLCFCPPLPHSFCTVLSVLFQACSLHPCPLCSSLPHLLHWLLHLPLAFQCSTSNQSHTHKGNAVAFYLCIGNSFLYRTCDIITLWGFSLRNSAV